jgi:glyoxylase-like metal-dependent hydrolase (beta-lactamase superfamily II)
MLVKDHGVLFGGDVIYKGRVPFLDSPETDTRNWLEGLQKLTQLVPQPRYVIPGHGDIADEIGTAISATREYIEYVRGVMREAIEDFTSFDEAYANADWSRYQHLPAFEASNRGNANRIYLELEAESLR